MQNTHLHNITKREGVFISYARRDEGLATQLRKLLEAEQISLWQDRVGLEGGRDWWLQITEALNHVGFMALIMTPAMASPIVYKEWRYARQQGVCVYPIKGSTDLNFNSLPRWMRDSHFYDLGFGGSFGYGPEWTKFLSDLNRTCETPRVPFMVEDLDDFVQRPFEFDQLINLLFDENREEPITITVALRGAGGFGKTTLASAICHDERIQAAFDDGILWVTLGKDPDDLIGHIENLIYTLSKERPGFTALNAATARLAELLADRDILMVIDDVWNSAHLRPFLQGGSRCARLITTRIYDALPPNANLVFIDTMRQSEAVEVLAKGLEQHRGSKQQDDDALRTLAQRLSGWPLLLRLANGALRSRVLNSGQPLPDVLAYVNKALDKRGLTAFDARDAKAREQAVAQTLEVSFELLDGNELRRYYELAVFPGNIHVPLETVAKLWGQDEFDAEMLCERMYNLSLLLRFDPTTRQIQLHDIVRQYLADKQANNIKALHSQLLQSHRPAPHLNWANLPLNEPYLWSHLAYHLKGAGHGEELVTTVQDLHYLAAKTFVSKPFAARADLLEAKQYLPNDVILSLLERAISQLGHVLNRCESLKDLLGTFYNYLAHFEALKAITQRLIPSLSRPYLESRCALPDFPPSIFVGSLEGHSGNVNACAFDSDKMLVVSASDDQTIMLWNVESGDRKLTLNGHHGSVNDCAINAEGTLIVSASDDGTLRVWDAESGRGRLTLVGHTSGVRGCAISRDGKIIVSASDDETLKVWDVETGKERQMLIGHSDMVNRCAISYDGEFIVSASADQTLKVWDAESGRARLTLTGHKDQVNDCAISSDHTVIVSASDDGTLKAWDAVSGKERLTLIGHTSGVRGCAISPDGKLIVSASFDRALKVWGRSERRSKPDYYVSCWSSVRL